MNYKEKVLSAIDNIETLISIESGREDGNIKLIEGDIKRLLKDAFQIIKKDHKNGTPEYSETGKYKSFQDFVSKL